MVPIGYWYCFASDDNPEIGGLHGLKQIFDEKGMGDRGLLLAWRLMKHNLNARAIAGLSDELISVQTNVDRLVRDMERAIAQADAFIASLQAE